MLLFATTIITNLLLLLLFPFTILQSYAENIDEQNLAKDPQWLAFLHYESVFPFLQDKSRIAQSNFFLAPNGKYHPDAELKASLTALRSGDTELRKTTICKFPARYEWLSGKIDLPDKQKATDLCSDLNEWFSGINPAGLTIIFPTSFLNNPASAFGHTLVRFDQPGQDDRTRLLAYGANYSAATSGEDAFTYAMKGLFGGFDGFYSVEPFHEKVTKYSDLENRDIWEYRLSLSKEEVRRLVLHIWELRKIPVSYFYLDENCSYHILTLIDVARPSLDFTREFRTWVMPIDTIRALRDKPGLILEETFRPSAATKLRHRLAVDSQAIKDAGKKLADSQDPAKEDHQGLNDQDFGEALDIAYELQTYRRIKARDTTDKGKEQAWKLLTARSALPPSNVPEVPRPSVLPEDGHKTGMFSIGEGRRFNRWVTDLRFRPAFHELIDRRTGYLPGAQIKFMDTLLSIEGNGDLDLQRLTPLQITSLTPRDDFFSPLSWQVTLEEERMKIRNEPGEPFVYSLEAGAGRAYNLWQGFIGYGLLDVRLSQSGSMDSKYSLGFGPRIGLAGELNDILGVELRSSIIRSPFGDEHTEFKNLVALRTSLDRDSALKLIAEPQRNFSENSWSVTLQFERFFTP